MENRNAGRRLESAVETKPVETRTVGSSLVPRTISMLIADDFSVTQQILDRRRADVEVAAALELHRQRPRLPHPAERRECRPRLHRCPYAGTFGNRSGVVGAQARHPDLCHADVEPAGGRGGRSGDPTARLRISVQAVQSRRCARHHENLQPHHFADKNPHRRRFRLRSGRSCRKSSRAACSIATSRRPPMARPRWRSPALRRTTPCSSTATCRA